MRSDIRFFSRSLCAMFLVVVHKSKRVDTSRTRGSRLVRGWMLDRCAVGSWTAKRMYKGTKYKVQRDKGQGTMYKGTRDKVYKSKVESQKSKAISRKRYNEKSPAEPDSFVCVI